MAILALDVGRKKIGLSISKSELISEEFCTINYLDQKKAIVEIIFLIKKNNIDKIVIGMPKNMDGTDSDMTKYVLDFVEIFKEKINLYNLKIKIFLEDERLTTKEAENLLFKKGLSIDTIKKRKDQFSAKLILDQYLDRNL